MPGPRYFWDMCWQGLANQETIATKSPAGIEGIPLSVFLRNRAKATKARRIPATTGQRAREKESRDSALWADVCASGNSHAPRATKNTITMNGSRSPNAPGELAKRTGHTVTKKRIIRRVVPTVAKGRSRARYSGQGPARGAMASFKAVLATSPLVKGAPASARAGSPRPKASHHFCSLPSFILGANPAPRKRAPLAKAWCRA